MIEFNNNHHTLETLDIIRLAHYELINKKALRRLPTRYASDIIGEMQSTCDTRIIGHSIRQIHDFFGWMAKNKTYRFITDKNQEQRIQRGHCAGAVYRTRRYMEIETQDRNGTKKASRNVHIEHTIPIRVLTRALINRFTGIQPSTEDVLQFIMNISICTAFHHKDEIAMKTHNVQAMDHLAFTDRGERIGDYPFARYLPLKANDTTFSIFNIISNKEIDLEHYTFSDHLETLKEASRLAIGNKHSCIFFLMQ